MRRYLFRKPVLLVGAGLLALGSAAMGAPGGSARAAASGQVTTASPNVATSSWTVYHYLRAGTGVAVPAGAGQRR